jgi:hypothetical protein
MEIAHRLKTITIGRRPDLAKKKRKQVAHPAVPGVFEGF